MLDADRPSGPDIEALDLALRAGDFAALTR
jgi:hypothetical protein